LQPDSQWWQAAGGKEHWKVNSDLDGDNGVRVKDLGDFLSVLSCQAFN